MDKVMTPSPHELLQYWKKGWPGYVTNVVDDYPALLDVAKKSATISGEDLETTKGHERIAIAITAIATFCHDTAPYCTKNLRFINKAFQTIIHEMQFVKRSMRLEEQMRRFNDYYDRDKRNAEENEKLAEECRRKSKEWHEKNWSEELEQDYQRWLASGMKIPSCKLEK